jgi:hypothetical protein
MRCNWNPLAHLKKRKAASDLIAITVEEYKTSRICNCCRSDNLIDAFHIIDPNVLVCKSCSALCNAA